MHLLSGKGVYRGFLCGPASGHECGTRNSLQKATEDISVCEQKLKSAEAGAEKYLTDERENRKLGSGEESGITVQRKYADADHQ